jgi:hypothetical protein
LVILSPTGVAKSCITVESQHGDPAMTRNIGPADRTLRLVLGAALILVALASGWPAFQGGLPRAMAVIAGVVLMITAAVRVCPLYTLLGMRTCRR